MAKKQLIDFVNKLKESGINISFTKPRSRNSLKLVQPKPSASMTIKS